MKRLYILCEGETEVGFIERMIQPWLFERGISVSASFIGKKPGTVTIEKLHTDLSLRLLRDKQCYCTTFFDFYGLLFDFVGKREAVKLSTIEARQQHVCQQMVEYFTSKIGGEPMRRFIPYVQMYEFEALLFSDPVTFANKINQPKLASEFQEIRKRFLSPEDINDSEQTAPSKRILALVKRYEKLTQGVPAAEAIGLAKIRQECKLFDSWITRLENLS